MPAALLPAITPLPIAASLVKKLKRVYVYGGSFDPPHGYHLVAPQLALRLLGEGAEKAATSVLLYVPAARNPLKQHAPGASDEQRAAMLRAGLTEESRRQLFAHAFSHVWTDEIDRARVAIAKGKPHASYTIDTVRRLRKLLPKACSVRLIIGVDQALAFDKWKDARQLFELAPPLVMPRHDIDSPFKLRRAMTRLKQSERFWTDRELGQWAMSLLPIYAKEVSSTQVRERLAGKTRAKMLREMHPSVAAYIEKHDLYRAGSAAAARQARRGHRRDACTTNVLNAKKLGRKRAEGTAETAVPPKQLRKPKERKRA